MEKESSISLGGTIILLVLFVWRYIFGQRYKNRKFQYDLIIWEKNKPMESTKEKKENSSFVKPGAQLSILV